MGLVRRGEEALGVALAVTAGFFGDFRAGVDGRADDAGVRVEDRVALPVDTETDAFGILLVADFAFAVDDVFVATVFFAAVLPALTFLLAEAVVFVAGFLALAEDSVFVATPLLAAFLATGVFFFATVFAAPTLPAGVFARAAGFFGDEPAAFFAAAFFAVADALLAAVFFVAVLLAAVFFFAGVFVFALRVAMTCSLGANAGLRSIGLRVPEVSGCSLEHPRTSHAIV
jgi:hypothetical protein